MRISRSARFIGASMCSAVRSENSISSIEASLPLSYSQQRRSLSIPSLLPPSSRNEIEHFLDQAFCSTTVKASFSTEAKTDTATPSEAVQELYNKMLKSVEARTMPPNAWLRDMFASCLNREDVKLLFGILQKLRIFRLSNLRIHDNFNSQYCMQIAEACARAGAVDLGLKVLWKHNVYGITPTIGSAHYLLLHAKEHNDAKAMVKILQVMKRNSLQFQPTTADIVFSITPNVNSSTNSQFEHELHNGRRGKKTLEEKTKVDSPSISESDMAMGSSDSSEEDLGIEKGKKMKKQKTAEGKSWRKKMKVYIEKQMKVFIDRQEEWFERIVKTLERREEERLATEEAWRKHENERLQVEHQFWAKERAWMQARDSTFIEALRKVMGRECTRASSSPPSPPLSFDLKEMQELETNKEDQALYNTSNNNNESTSSSSSSRRWPKHEILSLIRLRTAMDGRFQEGVSKGSLWEEISLKMTQLGYEKSGKRCKEKWENINKYFRKAKECNRTRRENSKTCPYFQYLEELYDSGDIRGIHEGFDNDYCEQEQKDAEASAEGLY